MTSMTDAVAAKPAAPSTASGLAERFREAARAAGFDLCGFAPAIAPPTYPRFLDWLAAGHQAGMEYLTRRREAYAHPHGVLDGARSVVVLAMSYAPSSSGMTSNVGALMTSAALPEPTGSQFESDARIARYAQVGADYHDTIRSRLRSLCDWLTRESPGCLARGVVDTAPLLERDFARLAGLGWFGKNTLLIHKRLGSWLFLAGILTDLELPPDEPFGTSHCGTCTRCLEACPTQAFPEPYVLDARRCIAYWTIEHRGTIPEPVRPEIGDWLFGCDVCQEVCPWNRKAPGAMDPEMQPRNDLSAIDPVELLTLDDAGFRARFRGTPLSRPRRAGLARNAAIVLGNRRAADAVPALGVALRDSEPEVRSAAAWALGQIRGMEAKRLLLAAVADERDATVLDELRSALDRTQLPA